jgi:hypothetical protein
VLAVVYEHTGEGFRYKAMERNLPGCPMRGIDVEKRLSGILGAVVYPPEAKRYDFREFIGINQNVMDDAMLVWAG